MKRRTFLKLVGASLPVLISSPSPVWASKADRRAVLLVELEGGNDALNTFVPYADEAYRRARPKLAIPPDEVVRLNERLGLHPAMRELAPSWEEGEMALVEGLGYAGPNRSHFRSIEIWETASGADEYLRDGWVARALGARGRAGGGDVPDGIVTGGGDDGPLAGYDSLHLGQPERTFRLSEGIARVEARTSNPALAHVIATQNDLVDSIGAIETGLSRAPEIGDFQDNEFGRQLGLAARIFASGLPVSVVKVSLGSFDTHVNQARRHARLLEELAKGLAELRRVAAKYGFWDRLLISTYSEFGRRVAENAGGGTDHGTASTQLLMGGGIAGGKLYGAPPSLDELQAGDVAYTTDFRRLYATISAWWGVSRTFDGHRALGVIS